MGRSPVFVEIARRGMELQLGQREGQGARGR